MPMATEISKPLTSYGLRSRPIQLCYRFLPIWCVLIMLLLSMLSYGLFQRDLYTDEAFRTSYTAHTSIGAVLEDVRKNEQTPPVYFVVLWLWAIVAGHGEVALRVLSLLLGLAAAYVFARLARRWLAPAEAIVAGIVFASVPVA